jgi:hypothetical protein
MQAARSLRFLAGALRSPRVDFYKWSAFKPVGVVAAFKRALPHDLSIKAEIKFLAELYRPSFLIQY